MLASMPVRLSQSRGSASMSLQKWIPKFTCLRLTLVEAHEINQLNDSNDERSIVYIDLTGDMIMSLYMSGQAPAGHHTKQ